MKLLALTATCAALTALTSLPAFAGNGSGANGYIAVVSNRLVAGDYTGTLPGGGKCTVKVTLENKGRGRSYQVEVSPSIQTYNITATSAKITIATGDARVLFDSAGERGTQVIGGKLYNVLEVSKTKSGKKVRVYLNGGDTLNVGECYI